jgi:2-polyprenyl-3-methyl-5-hydroxy-6-metoxy-1,4-benzoquinol methylase
MALEQASELRDGTSSMSNDESGQIHKTRERQYQRLLDLDAEVGRVRLGLMMNQAWIDDPKRFAFTFARYKFVAKMFEGFDTVAEIGAGDGFPSRIVGQSVGRLVISDFDPVLISDAEALKFDDVPHETRVHDILSGPMNHRFDGIYSLDVLEHIAPASEDLFMRNLVLSLSETGAAVIGMPSLESQAWASELSREGHVNCKSGPDLKSFMRKYFNQVFLFSMNDEVVHTGFSPMAHYLIAVCAHPRKF